MKTIPLTRGKFAIVDDADYEYLSQFKWYVREQKHVHGPSTFYARRKSGGKTIQMHRVILGLKPGDKLVVDHINHDGLDNRRENLRVGTHAQNVANMKSNHGSSRFKGVVWDKSASNWKAHIKKDQKVTHIGYYPTEEMAARSYDEKALELFGEYALLNFGPDDPESAEDIQRRREAYLASHVVKTSRFKGVSWHKAASKWVASIQKDKKQFHLGSFATEEDAAMIYDKKALELFGEHAHLNRSKSA